jgi:hypothetical protein
MTNSNSFANLVDLISSEYSSALAGVSSIELAYVGLTATLLVCALWCITSILPKKSGKLPVTGRQVKRGEHSTAARIVRRQNSLSFESIQDLTPSDLASAGIGRNEARNYRVERSVRIEGRHRRMWESRNRVVCLQTSVFNLDDLDLTKRYRITVGKVTVFAFIVPKNAAGSFDKEEDLKSGGLAIGFNNALLDKNRRLREMADSAERVVVTVEVTDKIGIPTPWLAMQGTHPNDDYNLSTLFLMIGIPVGFISGIGSEVFNHLSDPQAPPAWLWRSAFLALGFLVSALLIKLFRSTPDMAKFEIKEKAKGSKT